MQTGVLWAADIASFSDLEKITYVQFREGSVINGLDVVESYKNPPGTVAGLFTEENKSSRTELYEKNQENIKIAVAFWRENNMIISDDAD